MSLRGEDPVCAEISEPVQWPKMTLKFCVEFDKNSHKSQNGPKKIRTRISEDFLGPDITTPPPKKKKN